jgi:hypothetical protein
MRIYARCSSTAASRSSSPCSSTPRARRPPVLYDLMLYARLSLYRPQVLYDQLLAVHADAARAAAANDSESQVWAAGRRRMEEEARSGRLALAQVRDVWGREGT